MADEPHSNHSERPYIHLFRAEQYNFVLDLHTNRIFSLGAREAQLFNRWQNGETLAELVKEYPAEVARIQEFETQGLFQCEPPEGLAFGASWEQIREMILRKRQRTVIEITQRCNLACKYCTFGGGFSDHRVLTNCTMSDDLLRACIQSGFEYGAQLDEIGFGFYGGEPLCAFELLKMAVAFANQLAANTGKRLRFSITTNATLMDERKARFLRDEDFTVLVSLDGPQYMHDRYRVFRNGLGSYQATLKGLRTLLEVYPPEQHEKIGLSMVVPSSGWIRYLRQLWGDEPWLPKTLRANANLMNVPDGMELPKPPPAPDSTSIKAEWIASLTEERAEKTRLAWSSYDSPLAQLHQRPVFSGYRRTFYPNGCCIPGTRKIYVTVDGDYQICERVHGAPTIGTVRGGVDLEQIRAIVQEYCDSSFADCRECWAVSLCSMCFLHAYQNGKFSMEKKREYCTSTRDSRAARLSLYALVGKKFPHKLDEWDTYEIS